MIFVIFVPIVIFVIFVLLVPCADAGRSRGMQIHTISTRTHGRYLVDVPPVSGALPMLVGFHGYGERAEHMLAVLRDIRRERPWLLVSVQALNRFYTKSDQVVGNWMTREDRELAIADNIGYVTSVLDAVRQAHAVTQTIVYAGFSQGVAMAYRAAVLAARERQGIPSASGGIMLAGDVPPDVVPHLRAVRRLLLGRGTEDTWYTESKAGADLEHIAAAHVPAEMHVFAGGHVWDPSFIARASEFLEFIQANP